VNCQNQGFYQMKSILYPSLVIGILTALWFGVAAARTGQSRVLLGISGGFLGLVTSAICLGVGNAVSIPLSDAERLKSYLIRIVIAFVISALISFAFIKAVRKTVQKPAAG
jgi:hypothetical protein